MTTQLITSTTYLWRSLRGVRDEQDSSFKSLLELNVLDCWRLDSAGIPVAGGGGACAIQRRSLQYRIRARWDCLTHAPFRDSVWEEIAALEQIPTAQASKEDGANNNTPTS